MKKLFYFGLLGLVTFEILKVYFIMPMPGSQRMDSLDFAYFLHTWRWVFRLAFGAMIVAGTRAAFGIRWKWVPVLAVLPVAAITYGFNFKMTADHMFQEPVNPVYAGRDKNVVDEEAVVIGFENNGEARAYPVRFIVFHHQVRDTVGGKPVMVTYCSVCRTGRVYDPTVNGQLEKFRLVGMDHFNAMFEDAATGSWWRQVSGEAVTGKLKGAQLPVLPFTQVTLKRWFERTPERQGSAGRWHRSEKFRRERQVRARGEQERAHRHQPEILGGEVLGARRPGGQGEQSLRLEQAEGRARDQRPGRQHARRAGAGEGRKELRRVRAPGRCHVRDRSRRARRRRPSLRSRRPRAAGLALHRPASAGHAAPCRRFARILAFLADISPDDAARRVNGRNGRDGRDGCELALGAVNLRASFGARVANHHGEIAFQNPAPASGELLLPLHGGYRQLKSFQIAQLAYDVTVRFCDRYISRRSRTHDQMVQAARSGVQNIAEGSKASGTSKKTELKLTNVARASLEELKLDYEDYLRQRSLPFWTASDPRRRALVARRCQTADEVAVWVRECRDGRYGPNGRDGRNSPIPGRESIASMPSIPSMYPEISANAAHVLIGVACALLDRQIESLAASFEREGGFTERLYRVRTQRRQG